MVIQLSAEQRERLGKQLPDGYSLDDLRFITGSATIVNPEAMDPIEQGVIAKVTETAGPPKITDGKPTILRTVAWMVHEGPNRNREGFVKEELQSIAPALFRAPNFGVMDFNHSAVLPDFLSDGHPKVLGVWYKAEYAFDQAANGGKGAWGILATGMMFAWAYPDHANQLLGEQARSGTIKFSMACIPSTVEFAKDDQGSWAVLHNPVFFTLSALDVPPADIDARGVGTEKTSISDESLRQNIAQWTAIPSWMKLLQIAVAAAKQGELMNELEILKAEKTSAQQKLAEFEAKFATNTTEIAQLKMRVSELETKIAELETSRAAVVAELEAAQKTIVDLTAKAVADVTDLQTQLKTAQDTVAAFEKAAADKAKTDRLAARIAALPESFQAAHAKKPAEIKTRVETKWAEMDDAIWTQYVSEELLGYTGSLKVGYVAKSQAEGTTVTGDVIQETPGAIAAKLIKR